MRVARLGFAFGSAVVACQLLAPAIHAQAGDERAPVIRLTSELGASVVSDYIEPSVSLSEDAYVFAIAVDLDRTVRVLHPDGPGLSVKMISGKRLHLPKFFAGFDPRGQRRGNDGHGYVSSSRDSYDAGYSDTRGTIIALASRRPFDLDAVTSGGDWDFAELRRLVDGREPHSAASALARHLGARGEAIGRDIYRFAGAAHYYSTAYYNTAYYDCNPYSSIGYGYGYSSGQPLSLYHVAQLRAAGYQVSFIGVDGCGQPRFAVFQQGAAPTPLPQRPPATGAFPRSRLPAGLPRNPTRGVTTADRSTPVNPLASERHSERPRTPATGSFPERNPAPARTPERAAAPTRTPERANIPERAQAPERVRERTPAPERAADPAPPPARVEAARPAPQPESRLQPTSSKPVDG